MCTALVERECQKKLNQIYHIVKHCLLHVDILAAIMMEKTYYPIDNTLTIAASRGNFDTESIDGKISSFPFYLRVTYISQNKFRVLL